MPKQLMNEAERFLLEHWEEARLLEESMEGVRTKYKVVCQKIVEAVTETHRELDANAVYLTQSWTDGQIGFGRKSWPSDRNGNPSGLWVWNLRLELLAAEDSETPVAAIWVPKKSNVDFEAARLIVKQAAKDLLTAEELKRIEWGESDDESLLYLPAPSKRELLGALADADGQGFVALLITRFDMMARFVPVLDKVFRECLRKE
jgi:hypothetical protein